jgi:hypothetical protein
MVNIFIYLHRQWCIGIIVDSAIGPYGEKGSINTTQGRTFKRSS